MKTRDDSIIIDIFGGQLLNKVICGSCGYEAIAFDNFLCLNLPLPKSSSRITHSTSLEKCIEAFTSEDILVGKDAFHCLKCRKDTKGRKSFAIWRLPQILVLHLKRFQYSTWRKEKLDTMVEFPKTLDMKEYCRESSN